MAINWFPGHMHKARKEIAKLMPQIDVVIELVDARLPFSSENPLVDDIRGDTQCLKLLSKSDLADPEVTQEWLDYFNAKQGVKAIELSQKHPHTISRIISEARALVPERNFEKKELRALILGVPNVGKSTLLNALAGRQLAKTGNIPAVTKSNQRIKLEDGVVLHDTPGFLWPKLEPEDCGYRLAISGAIKDAILDLEDVAWFAMEYFLKAYPSELAARFGYKSLDSDPMRAFDQIAAKRGALRSGGIADLRKVSEILLFSYRQGELGRLSLERPSDIR